MKIILLYKPKLSSATKISFCIKNTKTATLQQVTSGNTPNIVLKRMLRYFAKTPPLKSSFKENARTFSAVPPVKKILRFQERIFLFS